MQMKLDERSGVSWCIDNIYRYGVVMRNDEGDLDVVRVYRSDIDTKYYDKGGSSEDHDRHNVLLTSCSVSDPPFVDVCRRSPVGKCFVDANPGHICRFRSDDASLRVRVVDDGAKISEQDFRDIRDHLWRNEKEDYKPVRSASAMALFALDEKIHGTSHNGSKDQKDDGYHL